MPLRLPWVRRGAIVGVALSACLAGAPDPATAQSTSQAVYVSPTGTDSETGGSQSSPLRTIGKAISVARQRDAAVIVADGTYPRSFVPPGANGTPTRIVAAEGAAPVIELLEAIDAGSLQFDGIGFNGIALQGVRDASFERASIRGAVSVGRSPFSRQPSRRISFSRVNASNEAGPCILIRDGSRSVAVRDSVIRDCLSGIGGPVNEGNSSGIRIERNRIERMVADAIQFGSWRDVVIDGNSIKDLGDPSGKYHSDAIQVTGDASDLAITNNRLADSSGQLILLGGDYGPIEDVRVENNLLTGAKAYAMQAGGVQNLRIRNNTIWDSGWGLLLRADNRFGRPTPTDTVVTNNVMSHFLLSDYPRIGVNYGNIVKECGSRYRGNVCASDLMLAPDYSYRSDYPLQALLARQRGARLSRLPG